MNSKVGSLMTGSSEMKFPNAANLFSFCREVLDRRFSDAKVRGKVIDQDVGQLLGMDPADCSHWKRGKKPIRSLDAVRAIAEQLNVDEHLIAQIAAGEINDEEALLEYNGPGAFQIDHKDLEHARKDWFRRLNRDWSKDEFAEFRNAFSVDVKMVDSVVAEIHGRIRFNEAPLFFPEIFSSYPELKMDFRGADKAKLSRKLLIPRLVKNETNLVWEVQSDPEAATRPVLRYYLAKALGAYFLKDHLLSDPYVTDLHEFVALRNDVYYNVFAARLLAPASFIQRELTALDLRRDIISQLATTFWVSRSFMNTRLRDVLIGNRAIDEMSPV